MKGRWRVASGQCNNPQAFRLPLLAGGQKKRFYILQLDARGQRKKRGVSLIEQCEKKPAMVWELMVYTPAASFHFISVSQFVGEHHGALKSVGSPPKRPQQLKRRYVSLKIIQPPGKEVREKTVERKEGGKRTK